MEQLTIFDNEFYNANHHRLNFKIERKNVLNITDRVKRVMTDFDIKAEHADEVFEGSLDVDLKGDWNIGLIVGGSGTGKSTIARELFGDSYVYGYEYDDNSVLDNMPQERDIGDIEMAFTAVGFSSPPCWLKPYRVLSTGEKMRVDLARAILESKELVAFDEFTSVVDRTVAKTCSIAVQKQVRRLGRKFVAVSCHKDIIEYLSPDWIYDTDQKSFFGRGGNTIPQSMKWTYTELVDSISNEYGQYLGSITI